MFQNKIQTHKRLIIIIIIMYIYHGLINAMSTHNHIMHINLNTILCMYVKDSPTKTIYIRHYMETHTHNDCSRNWVLILVGAGIL